MYLEIEMPLKPSKQYWVEYSKVYFVQLQKEWAYIKLPLRIKKKAT